MRSDHAQETHKVAGAVFESAHKLALEQVLASINNDPGETLQRLAEFVHTNQRMGEEIFGQYAVDALIILHKSTDLMYKADALASILS